MKQKLQTLLSEINQGLIERDAVFKTALLTLLTGEHLVLIGPPGTAKSVIARRLADCVEGPAGEKHFEYLLTKFSTPDEIFGPLSISALKADRFERNTAGYLPTARVAFLDEIFKANSAILNALLTILNERIFHNGNHAEKVPLLSLVAASNELPVGKDELNALYDRFLVRTVVGPVSEEGWLQLMAADTAVAEFKPSAKISVADVEALRQQAAGVQIPTEIAEVIRAIWSQHQQMFRESKDERLSDRRLVKVLKLFRMSAATNGRDVVDLSDVLLLKDCLWNHDANATKVHDLVKTTLQKYSYPVPVEEWEAAVNPTYVIGQDGKTLELERSVDGEAAASTIEQALRGVSTALAKTQHTTSLQPRRGNPQILPARTKTKGFAGTGTAHDPIRISSADDLISIDDRDICTKGFHFVQTADIDCSAFTHWPAFAFNGHYDGNGKTISKLLQTKDAKGDDAASSVFATLPNGSSVINLTLDTCCLATTVEGSLIEDCMAVDASLIAGNTSVETQITRCQADRRLVIGTVTETTITDCSAGRSLTGAATNATITHCQAMDGALVDGAAKSTNITHCQATGGALVNGDVSKVEITACQASGGALVNGNAADSKIIRCQIVGGHGLVWGTASATQITDCAAVVGASKDDDSYGGFIAKRIQSKSAVERCFAAGSFVQSGFDLCFGGIVGESDDSSIRHCAVGTHTVKLRYSVQRKRIAYSVENSSTVQNNAAIDTTPGTDDKNGSDGKTVAAGAFKQRFFEDTLGWNFKTVWQWDDANQRPSLRAVGPNPVASSAAPMPEAMEDLLTRQVLGNMWL